ncbi:MAG: YceI family protein [Saprospiraceae bacterium]
MKKLLFLPLLAVLVMAASSSVSTYKADLVSSNIIWKGYKVTGEHTGTVKVKSGNLQMTDGKLTGGAFEIDMTTITCVDLEGPVAGKLVGHLKSDDFFGVEKFPTAKFVITRAIPTDSKGNYKIIGNMTLKETTKEIKFPAAVSEANGQVTTTAKITIDRSEYNVRFGSGTFFDNLGDKTIYDEFDLNVTLVTKK